MIRPPVALTTIGRRAERERIEGALRAARTGSGVALLISGAPGSGRTSLLDHAAHEASNDGFVVRRARGRRAERTVDGAVVHEAFDAVAPQPAALLEAMVQIAAAAPLLVTVDDLHDADVVSIEMLTYCARRVLRHPIVVLLAGAVDGSPLDALVEDIERLVLGALLDDEILRVFEAVAGPLEHGALEAVRHVSGGNPLAVVEIARGSTVDQRAGREPFPDLPAVGTSVVKAFARPLLELPDATRRALCVLAAEPTGRLDVVGRALALLDVEASALEPAEEAGLLTVVDGAGRFDHAMRRVVAYASLAAPSRRAAHRALAAAWEGDDDAERRVAHLVAGTVGADDTVAESLAALAGHLERRGRTSAASEAWTRAAERCTAVARRAEWQARAAGCGAGTAPSGSATGRLSVLTKAELRVARVVAEGLSNRQAAERLYLSLKTVDAHLQSIYRKLQVTNRAALAVLVTVHDRSEVR